MRVLAFDTALTACSAALLEDGGVRAARREDPGRGHGERLVPMIEALLDEAEWSYQDLDLLCVTRGPGSFTGLRIGLATARGLALALALPVLGVTTLEALAAGVAAEPGQSVLALIDARRGQLYAQAFDARGEALALPVALAPEAVASLAPPAPAVLVGSGVALARPHLALQRPDLTAAAAPELPEAALFGALAFARQSEAVRGAPPSPLYLRSPDAEPRKAPQ
jgi:tRNA threonylcarbamoyladenosine biosynthesis protein TsaB